LVTGVAVLATFLAGFTGGAAASEVGYFDPDDASWYLPGTGGAVSRVAFGAAGHTPFVGDWDCDGVDSPAMYDPHTGYAYFNLSPDADEPDFGYHFGLAGDVPLAGDWDGDGCDGFGIYRPATGYAYLADSLGIISTRELDLGQGTPFVADSDRDGRDEVAVYHRANRMALFDPAPDDRRVTSALGRAVYDGRLLSLRELEMTGSLERIVPVSGNFGLCREECGGLYPTLKQGDRGRWVDDLRTALAALGFRPGQGSEYDKTLEGAVLAFEKYHGLERDGIFDRAGWDLLEDALQIPFRAETSTRIEVDLGRQILFLIVDHQLAGVIPVSSANGGTYTSWDGSTRTARTPEGQFELYREEGGWYRSYLGAMYEPYFFRGGYAIHGSNSVPAYPASHGCIRTQTWDHDWLKPQLAHGMPVFVYGDRIEATDA
jgi:peptidoglycan hydrolase-like protein with peptidoglycan-binding domain